jgi:hypothetical protein
MNWNEVTAEGHADHDWCCVCDHKFLREDGVEAVDGTLVCSDDCALEIEDENPNIWIDPEDRLIDGVGFADPGGRSALRGGDMLTPIDRQRGYQCDICADQAEMGY